MNDSLLIAAPLMIAAIVMAVRFVGCGLPGADPPPTNNAVVTGNLTGHGIFSAKVESPESNPETQQYDKAGTYAYSIPYWCTTIDVILLGAGGGGGHGGTNDVGGGGGGWKTATLQRGSDIPMAATTINVTVGQGGMGGTASAPEGTAGGDTTATWDTTSGPTTSTAAGGAARGSSSGVNGDGPSPSSESVGDASLNGGAAQSSAGADGNPPGGGGAAGGGFKPAGAGADGAAVLLARQS
jgi:Glycine-rich domain